MTNNASKRLSVINRAALGWAWLLLTALGAVSVSAQTKLPPGTIKLPPKIDISCRPALYFGGEVGSGNEINKNSRYVVAGERIVLRKADSFLQSNGKYAFNIQYFVFGTPAKDVLALDAFTNRLRIGDEIINQHSIKFADTDGGANDTKIRVIRTQAYLPVGTSVITLSLDDDKKVKEKDESNNQHNFTVIVQP